ncbi:hypothetical protein CN176_14520 [Sinorhizobium medicae]|nr:hypothetical protein CN176_14520 [Sinorhizobium medicae]RVO71692.1 hypothetical protein CN084_28955 [Sinorhizobium medicae]
MAAKAECPCLGSELEDELLPSNGEMEAQRAPQVSFAPPAGRRWPAGRMRGSKHPASIDKSDRGGT